MSRLTRKSSPKSVRGVRGGQSQIRAFKDAARAFECDESEEAFDRALGKIGKATPEPKAQKPRKKPVKLAI